MEQISKGATQHEVARHCGLGIRTIRRWIRAHGFPERKIGDRKSPVDKCSEYLEQRWKEGATMPPNGGTKFVAARFRRPMPDSADLGSEALWFTTECLGK
jgi:hypothetical protein